MIEVLETPAETQRQESVTRILDSAERLFRHYGYAKTNVADIAKDLGMSPANIYRFFASKVEIHQAICARLLSTVRQLAELILSQDDVSAEDRLRQWVHALHKITVETMMDQERVHEMVIVAMERDWHVVDAHIDRLNIIVADVIREGIALGEFPKQDPDSAARCFGAATALLCHPQMVAQCLAKPNRATPGELVEFAIRALKN
ncbi:TetR family transcriptional regulator [Rhizobium sp. TH2]|uniref:TetR family transcriptional regulator n=1 Tax=Rhizobium sp. TH2 TaxID=2775403 RepID=UPI002157C57F|nr:TetR family transcriptional regulator [Rhizobium sp. TH2]UVC07450.1 TetR family transcriptional regulator [Rhizobium sp. TH2]